MTWHRETRELPEKMKVDVRCRMCGTYHTLTVNTEMFMRWSNREILVQNAFPELSLDQRELLISQICGSCFDEMFGGEL